MIVKQKTINREARLDGIGLQTGETVHVVFKPAPVHSGIRFVRMDIPSKPVIPADISHVVDFRKSPHRTSLSADGVEVQTVEHLLAALCGLEIDNLIVELDSNELPGLDGSAAGFVETLERAGMLEQEEPRKFFEVKEPVSCEQNGVLISIFPADTFKISYSLFYDHPAIGSQYMTLEINPAAFKQVIAPSRTFCLEDEGLAMRKAGQGKGANYQNIIVVGKKGVLQNQLRFRDEFVRHKIADIVGDLYLLGMPIHGHVIAARSGHVFNIKLLHKMKIQYERFFAARMEAPEPETAQAPVRVMDLAGIKGILPHREPFLFVDSIKELGQRHVVGTKQFTLKEDFYRGHFPGHPVTPGVILIEAMAQVVGVLLLSRPEARGRIAYFMSIDKVKFRKPVLPGDRVRFEVDILKEKTRTSQARGVAKVEDKVVAEAEFMFSIVET